MNRVVWIEVSPRNPATAAPSEVLLAGGGQDAAYRHPVNGRQYRAGVVRLPLFSASLGFDANGWNGSTRPQTSIIAFSTADPNLRAALAGQVWKDAPISVSVGLEGAAPAAILVGKVQDAEFTRAGMSLTIVDLAERLERPIIASQFGGSGGIEGPVQAKGRVKRRSWGYVFNVEGRLLDVANSVYEFGDPAFPLISWTALRDKGREGAFTAIAWQGSIEATLAALAASSPARGGGVVAPSIACAKWWTQPAGPLTADFVGSAGTGGSMQPAAIADAISQAGGGPAIGGLGDAVALRPALSGIHIAGMNESFAQAIDRLLLGVSLLWLPRPQGVIEVREWAFSDAAPVMKGIFKGRARTLAPHGKRRIGFQRNERPHNASEIAGILLEELTDGGEPLAAADLLNSGQQWDDVLDGTGTRPANNATAGATLGTDFKSPGNVIYTQAQIETLLGTANAIVGQGSGATANTLAQLNAAEGTKLTGIAAGATNDTGEDTRNDDFTPMHYRANWLRRLRTEFKFAAAIGLTTASTFVTLESYAVWWDPSGGPVWQRATDGSGIRYIRFSQGATGAETWTAWKAEFSENRKPAFGGDLLESAGGTPASLAEFKTILGPAAAIVGQGSGATANTLAQLNAAEGTKLTGIAAGATNDTGEDTRNDDFTPMHYRANWLRRLRTEFKFAPAIGLTTASTFVTLESYAVWWDPSGGPVWQRATDGSGIRYIRFSQGATGAETWTAWKAEFSENRKPAFGGDLLESAGGTPASLAEFKTILGPAAAIVGQGSGATANTLAQLNAAEGTKLTGIEAGADVTATAQRAIEPQFPVIEIKQGEAGHTGDRAVTHAAKKGTAALAGGTWSLPAVNLGAGGAAINAGTGTVTLSGIVGSGAYTVRYTHTDGIATELPVNVTFVPLVAAGTANSATSSTKAFSTSGFTAISNDMTIALPAGVTTASLLATSISLEVPNALPAGATDVEVKWQRETSPGTWADVGAVAASSPSPSVVDEGGFPSAFAGAVTCNRTATGLAAGSTQKFRLVARISGGAIRTVTPFGAVTVGG